MQKHQFEAIISSEGKSWSWRREASGTVNKDEDITPPSGGLDASVSCRGLCAGAQQMLELVACGDVTALRRLLSKPLVPKGQRSLPYQLSSLGEEAALWAARLWKAAVQGGVPLEEAACLRDGFLVNCKEARTPDALVGLVHRMALEFAGRVHGVCYGKNPTPLVKAVSDYVMDHLSQRVKVEDMAKAFFMSRYYLSAKFKKEAGVSVTDYVLGLKVHEAKKLLRERDRSITEIGCWLGFSTTSHFSHVFKKYVGQTPSEYRACPNP